VSDWPWAIIVREHSTKNGMSGFTPKPGFVLQPLSHVMNITIISSRQGFIYWGGGAKSLGGGLGVCMGGVWWWGGEWMCGGGGVSVGWCSNKRRRNIHTRSSTPTHSTCKLTNLVTHTCTHTQSPAHSPYKNTNLPAHTLHQHT